MLKFFDFEVFKHDWMIVIIDPAEREQTIIENDPDQLREYYEAHKDDVFVGYNCRNYDQWIFKAILAGFDPKEVNDWIILERKRGFEFSNVLRKYPIRIYDVYQNIDRGLKFFEGCLGNDIQETTVSFDLDRKLTPDELAEVRKYCIHDVEQTIEVFLHRKADFDAHMGLIKMFDLPLSYMGKTKTQLSATILGASKHKYDDEFDIDIPPTLDVVKYRHVVDWYLDPVNRSYTLDPADPESGKRKLETVVAGVPHVFGWGGVHGALEQYNKTGYFINMDVASLYPSLMIQYNLHSRSCDPEKFTDIYNTRLKYKAEKNPLQAPLKIVLNSTYGALKDKYNPLYDPRQANRICVYGQLLLLDLIEHLERTGAEIVQSNTDGVLIRMPDDFPGGKYEFFGMVDDVAYEWEERTGLNLEFDEYVKVVQKDVNNYVVIDAQGNYKSKGAYVKKLGALDYDLAVVNTAVKNYIINGVPVEDTIRADTNLMDFQMICRLSWKYKDIIHNGERLNERTVRVFASTDKSDGTLYKIHAETGSTEKVAGTPEHCFILNDSVVGVDRDERVDVQWYIDAAKKRLEDFGL